jgi:hypothetical protein
MVERGKPDLEPTVCSSTAGMPKAELSTRPPVRRRIALWIRFIILSPKSERVR